MLDSLLSLILIYGYPLIGSIGFLASLGLPLPATALYIASGAFVATGYMDGKSLFLTGAIACILGDMSGYFLARGYGRGIFRSTGLERFFPLDTVEKKYGDHMMTHGFFLVFLSRFIFTAIGPAVNILAGFMKTKWKIFIIADILGEMLYTGITLGLGYSFTSEWETIVSLFSSASSLLSSALIFGGILYILWKNRSRFAR